MRADGKDEVRIADLQTFLTIMRAGSVSGAARALQVTPSQVSKAVLRLEQQLGTRLLVRGARGVTATDAARRLAPRCEEIVAGVRALRGSDGERAPELTVVASSYLSALFIPPVAAALPRFRIRSLELPPGSASAFATEHRFDVALTTVEERWPATWVKTRVGPLRKALYGPPEVGRALGRSPVAVERVAELRFVVPIYGFQGQVVSGDDGCPLPVERRQIGHQTQTLLLALEVAAASGHVVFGASLAVRPYVAAGRLVEIPVTGWAVADDLFVVCDGERVRARVQRDVVAAVGAAIVDGGR